MKPIHFGKALEMLLDLLGLSLVLPLPISCSENLLLTQ